MPKKARAVPKPIYDVTPYFYMVFGLCVIYLQDNLFIMLTAWVVYTAGAIIFALRSDHRRANRKEWDRDSKLVNWHEDIYESIPFFYLGAGVLVAKYADTPLMLFGGVVLGLYGVTVLMIRITRRKISWIQEWQRYHTPGRQPVTIQPLAKQKGRIVYCERCTVHPVCKSTGLCDKSNSAVMKWLQGSRSKTTLTQLHDTLRHTEGRHVPKEELREVAKKLLPYVENCVSWGVRGVERRNPRATPPGPASGKQPADKKN